MGTTRSRSLNRIVSLLLTGVLFVSGLPAQATAETTVSELTSLDSSAISPTEETETISQDTVSAPSSSDHADIDEIGTSGNSDDAIDRVIVGETRQKSSREQQATDDASFSVVEMDYKSQSDKSTLIPMLSAESASIETRSTIALGNYHSAAIKTDGSLYTWGYHYWGQLGDGATAERHVPAKVMEDAVSVSIGGNQSAAISSDGSLWMWGENTFGQLGDGTKTNRATPIKIMDGVIAVSLGDTHSAAIKADGTLWMWGYNVQGQLGDGTTNDHLTPFKLMDKVVSVSLGGSFSAAIKSDGSLWMWGINSYGQLGDGTTVGRKTPVKIMDGVVAVALGNGHSAAVKSDGTLWTWGAGNNGTLGDGSTSNKLSPGKVMDDVVSVACGGTHTGAIKSDGSLWAWGANYDGQLGDGTKASRTTPAKVLDDVAAIALGSYHSAAIKTDGSLWTWGRNENGQLGDGSTTNRSTPVKVLDDVAYTYTSSLPADSCYLPSRDGWGFTHHNAINGAEEISEEAFYRVFDRDQESSIIFELLRTVKHLCEGLAITSAMTYAGRPPIESWEGSAAKSASEFTSLDLSRVSNATELTLVEYIQACWLFQFTEEGSRQKWDNWSNALNGWKHFGDMVARVNNFHNHGTNPIVVVVRGWDSEAKGVEGHDLVPYRVVSGSDCDRMYVYDCNYGPYDGSPSDERYIELFKDGDGNYTGWSYRVFDVADGDLVWRSGEFGSMITYYDDFSGLTRAIDSQDTQRAGTGARGTTLFHSSSGNVSVSDSRGNSIVFDSGSVEGDVGGTFLPILESGDAQESEYCEGALWYYDSANEGESASVMVSGFEEDAMVLGASSSGEVDVLAHAGSTVVVSAGEEVGKTVCIEQGAGSSFEVKYVTGSNGEAETMAVSGVGSGRVRLRKTGGGCTICGAVELEVRNDYGRVTRCEDLEGEKAYLVVPGDASTPPEVTVSAATWSRLAGGNRYDTMAAIVQEGFLSSEWAVVATGANFPDALVASSLAGSKGCPVVLTATKSLSKQARAELSRLGVSRAYVVGGESAVSSKVESELKGMGITVTRVAGSSRQATSLEAAKRLSRPSSVVICTGASFADALSIGPWCYRTVSPILLTGKDGSLTKSQLEWLGTCGAKSLVVVGGTTALPEATADKARSSLGIAKSAVTRLAGANRYATSAAVAEWELGQGMGVANVAVATGRDYPDALAGAALCGRNGSVLALVSAKDTSAIESVLNDRASEVSEGYVLGGESTVPASVMELCERLTAVV